MHANGHFETENIFDKIQSIMDRLPKKQKKLCKFILESYRSIGYFTVKDLAQEAGVGTTTVMRLVQTLGFSSYISMRKAIHNMALQSPPNVWWTLEESFKKKDFDSSDALSQAWKEIQLVLDKTWSPELQANIVKAVDLMLDASVINILGLRSSRPIADYFHYVLEQFYPKARQLSFDSEVLFDRILRFKPDELLFVITFHPYTTKTIEAARFCRERGNRIVLLTDYGTCPIARYADLILKMEPSRTQYSIVPAIATVETLIIELGKRTSGESISSLTELNAMLRKFKINYLD